MTYFCLFLDPTISTISTEMTTAMNELHYSNLFDTLPYELIEAIFNQIFSTRDLKSLCLVNKRIHAIAKNLLWREPHLRNFTLEDFKWISKMPIHVLDTSRLISFDRGKNCCNFGEFDLTFVTELSNLVSQMDHLDHLKLPWDYITARRELWSILVDQCNVRNVSLVSLCPVDEEGLAHFIHLLKEQLPRLKYVESLEAEFLDFYFDEEELILSNNFEHYLPPDISKLKKLTLNVDIEPGQYAMLFKMLRMIPEKLGISAFVCKHFSLRMRFQRKGVPGNHL